MDDEDVRFEETDSDDNDLFVPLEVPMKKRSLSNDD